MGGKTFAISSVEYYVTEYSTYSTYSIDRIFDSSTILSDGSNFYGSDIDSHLLVYYPDTEILSGTTYNSYGLVAMPCLPGDFLDFSFSWTTDDTLSSYDRSFYIIFGSDSIDDAFFLDAYYYLTPSSSNPYSYDFSLTVPDDYAYYIIVVGIACPYVYVNSSAYSFIDVIDYLVPFYLDSGHIYYKFYSSVYDGYYGFAGANICNGGYIGLSNIYVNCYYSSSYGSGSSSDSSVASEDLISIASAVGVDTSDYVVSVTSTDTVVADIASALSIDSDSSLYSLIYQLAAGQSYSYYYWDASSGEFYTFSDLTLYEWLYDFSVASNAGVILLDSIEDYISSIYNVFSDDCDLFMAYFYWESLDSQVYTSDLDFYTFLLIFEEAASKTYEYTYKSYSVLLDIYSVLEDFISSIDTGVDYETSTDSISNSVSSYVDTETAIADSVSSYSDSANALLSDTSSIDSIGDSISETSDMFTSLLSSFPSLLVALLTLCTVLIIIKRLLT